MPVRPSAGSATAAPPASSDRLYSPEEAEGIRTYPVRVMFEQDGGRTFAILHPVEISIFAADAVEWDFRYLRGADLHVVSVTVEIERPSPFAKTVLRSKKPPTARPHRDVSGPAKKSAAGRRSTYTVRAFDFLKNEIASAEGVMVIQSGGENGL